MYVTASLPSRYGTFNQIKKDNYPFRTLFTRYLEAISRVGLDLEMDADMLVGLLEDQLLGMERLPDIPEGTEKVSFRFSIDNETIESYFKGSELSNKTIIMLIVRTTLRLSERFGTSLSRLTRLISELSLVSDVDKSVESVDKPVEEQIPIRITKALKPKAVPKPAKAVEPITVEQQEEKSDNNKTMEKGSVLDRLEALTRKGEELLQDEDDDTAKVETNPLLSEFF